MNEQEQLEQAIQHLEDQRAVLGDEVVQTALKPLREKLDSLRKKIAPEQRKQVTVLFADLAGFTSLAEKMDPEDVREVLDEYFKRWTELIKHFGGQVEKYIGDAVMAVYGMQQAREDDPERAVQTALGMAAELSELNRTLEKRFQISLNMRIGVHTGLVVVSLLGERSESSPGQEFVIVGDTVNLASRLQSLAPLNGILISQETYNNLRDLFEVQALDPIQVKGKSLPVQAYQVLRRKPSSFLARQWGVEGVQTRMVGRDRELNLLQEIFVSTIEDRERQVVTLVGEAGIGKSRLMNEFEMWVKQQPDLVQVFHARARLESQSLPYGLLRSLFALRFEILDDDPLVIVNEKITQGFQGMYADGDLHEREAQWIGHLIGYDFSGSPHLQGMVANPQQFHEQALLYLTEAFEASANRTPVLFLLEDMHWADDTSLDILTRLALELDRLPIILIGSARPEFFELRPHWFEGRPFHTRLDLHPLTRRESSSLVEEALQKVENLPKTLGELIVNNAEGNPFYLEELIKMFVDRGVIIKNEPHWHVQADLLAEVDVPSTLIGILQARLDSLVDKEKILLQQASVVGRIFWDRVLVFLNQSGEARLDEKIVQNLLGELRGKEMLFQREPSAFAETREYIFKHAVLREVTYESVLRRLRKDYHAKVAEWLIEHSRQRPGEIAGLVADHLLHAGKEDLAVTYLEQAGDEAARSYANPEAIQFYQRALLVYAHLETASADPAISSTGANLYEKLGDVFVHSGRSHEAQQAYQNALTQSFQKPGVWQAGLHRKIGDTLVPQYLHSEAFSFYEQAEKLLGSQLENVPLSELREWLDIQLAISQLLYWEQRWPEMEIVHKKIHSFIETKGRLDQKIHFLSLQAQANIQHEHYRISRDTMDMFRSGYALALETQNPYDIAFALFKVGFALLLFGDLEDALEHIHNALEMSEKFGVKMVQVRALNYLSLVYRFMGNVQAVQRYAHKSMEVASQVGEHYYIGHAHGNLAWIAWKEGEIDLAYQEAMSAFKIWDSHQVESTLPAVFQRTAAWPAVAAAVSRDQLSEAAVFARRMLPPYDPPLPDDIQVKVAEAIQAVENGDEQTAKSLFTQALDWNNESGGL